MEILAIPPVCEIFVGVFHLLQVLAKSLANTGIDTTVIADSAVFAMMARVNKVRLLL